MNNPLAEDDEDLFLWEEYDYESNKLYYEYCLEQLENYPKREANFKPNRKESKPLKDT